MAEKLVAANIWSATVLRQSFHNLDIARHPAPEQAQKPSRDQLGLVHLAFQVEHYSDLRDAYVVLLEVGGPGDPLPEWLNQTWPAPEMQAQIDALRTAPVGVN